MASVLFNVSIVIGTSFIGSFLLWWRVHESWLKRLECHISRDSQQKRGRYCYIRWWYIKPFPRSSCNFLLLCESPNGVSSGSGSSGTNPKAPIKDIFPFSLNSVMRVFRSRNIRLLASELTLAHFWNIVRMYRINPNRHNEFRQDNYGCSPIRSCKSKYVPSKNSLRLNLLNRHHIQSKSYSSLSCISTIQLCHCSVFRTGQ